MTTSIINTPDADPPSLGDEATSFGATGPPADVSDALLRDALHRGSPQKTTQGGAGRNAPDQALEGVRIEVSNTIEPCEGVD